MQNNLQGIDTGMGKVDSKYVFKVFKATTRFKKFRRGLTKFTRKKYSRRKHRNNWFGITYLTVRWSVLVMKHRQFLRFYQSMSLFQFNSYSSTRDVFLTTLTRTSSASGIFLFSCSKSILSYFNTNNTINVPLTKSETTFMAGYVANSLQNSVEFNPGIINFNNLYYPFHNNNLTLDHKWGVVGGLIRELLRYILRYTVLLYKIHILMVLWRF